MVGAGQLSLAEGSTRYAVRLFLFSLAVPTAAKIVKRDNLQPQPPPSASILFSPSARLASG